MKQTLIGLAAALVLTGVLAPAAARGQLVRLEGRVQWVAGQMAVVHLDTGPVVSVDLTRVPQDEYLALKTRERVTVVGTVSEDGKVAATSILRGAARTEETPARRTP
jgi:hypothetical protein